MRDGGAKSGRLPEGGSRGGQGHLRDRGREPRPRTPTHPQSVQPSEDPLPAVGSIPHCLTPKPSTRELCRVRKRRVLRASTGGVRFRPGAKLPRESRIATTADAGQSARALGNSRGSAIRGTRLRTRAGVQRGRGRARRIHRFRGSSATIAWSKNATWAGRRFARDGTRRSVLARRLRDTRQHDVVFPVDA